jgi:hypothetical protein
MRYQREARTQRLPPSDIACASLRHRHIGSSYQDTTRSRRAREPGGRDGREGWSRRWPGRDPRVARFSRTLLGHLGGTATAACERLTGHWLRTSAPTRPPPCLSHRAVPVSPRTAPTTLPNSTVLRRDQASEGRRYWRSRTSDTMTAQDSIHRSATGSSRVTPTCSPHNQPSIRAESPKPTATLEQYSSSPKRRSNRVPTTTTYISALSGQQRHDLASGGSRRGAPS